MTPLSVQATLNALVPTWAHEDVLRAYRTAVSEGHPEAAVFEAELRRRLATASPPPGLVR